MKFAIFIGIVLLAIAVALAGLSFYSDYQVKQDLAELQLADDASTPQQKAEFLGTFIERMESRRLPEYAAWLFPTPREKVSNQLDVIKSLKERCDALAKVDPASLGYAQGMQQVSGQEFDHATSKVAAIFDKALSIRHGWFAFYGWIVFALAGIATLIVTAIVNDR